MGSNPFRTARPVHGARMSLVALLAILAMALAMMPAPTPARAAAAATADTSPPVVNACSTLGTLAQYFGFTLKAMGPSAGVQQLAINGTAITLEGNPVVTPAGWGMFVGGTILTIFCPGAPPIPGNPLNFCDIFSQLTTLGGYAVKAIQVTEGSEVLQLALEGGAIALEGVEVASPIGWGLMLAPFVINLACSGSSPPELLTPPTALSTPLPLGATSITICYDTFENCASGGAPVEPLPTSSTVCDPTQTDCSSLDGGVDPVGTSSSDICYETSTDCTFGGDSASVGAPPPDTQDSPFPPDDQDLPVLPPDPEPIATPDPNSELTQEECMVDWSFCG